MRETRLPDGSDSEGLLVRSASKRCRFWSRALGNILFNRSNPADSDTVARNTPNRSIAFVEPHCRKRSSIISSLYNTAGLVQEVQCSIRITRCGVVMRGLGTPNA